ncbi:MAG TPA: hypothetical protein VFS08_05745 [Gemmatimonadaceae bacterium]|nr:hypothetical protein [Gemmatimonadaceae bacterium]
MTEHRRSDELTDAERAAEQETARRGSAAERAMRVRESDLEPYVGLGYLSKLFRFIAVFLAILLVAEVATGLVAQGRSAIPTLLAEASRLIVLAGLLWGAGDLAILLIDVGHDVRAARILLGRQVAHHLEQHHGPGDVERPVSTAAAADRGRARREPAEASRTGPTGL